MISSRYYHYNGSIMKTSLGYDNIGIYQVKMTGNRETSAQKGADSV